MAETNIEWTDKVWNPTRGCSRVSEGCRNCYAERQAIRHRSGIYNGFVTITNGHPAWTGRVELIADKLMEPLRWTKPRRVFVNSMSDVFHEALSDAAIDRIFAVMAICQQHTFQVLTKRPERMLAWMKSKRGHLTCEFQQNPARSASSLLPLPNVWLGVSVEDRKNKDRIDLLRETPAAVRFLSIEPLLEDIGQLDLLGISWVIVGGESGPGARAFNIQWAEDVVSQCRAAGVSVFVKQLGSNPWDGPDDPWVCIDRKGGLMSEWPEELRVREFPEVHQ